MNKYKIMVVDDEPDILNLMKKALNIEGYNDILLVDNGFDAVTCCKNTKPDIIILDVMLPGIDGYEVCRQIRQFSHSPILFLSSKNDELDKILGLALGGDDYITKPFSPKEIVYRVKAQTRRLEYLHQPEDKQIIKIGDLIINPNSSQALKKDKDLELTAREFGILNYLAKNKGRIISKERIYEAVWKEDGYGCDNTIMVHIRHLREKLENDPASPAYLITVKGLGYKLVDPDE